jgi:hypothetical protein
MIGYVRDVRGERLRACAADVGEEEITEELEVILLSTGIATDL